MDRNLNVFLKLALRDYGLGLLFVRTAIQNENMDKASTQKPIPGLASSLSLCVAPPLITNRWNIREKW